MYEKGIWNVWSERCIECKSIVWSEMQLTGREKEREEWGGEEIIYRKEDVIVWKAL